MSDLPAEPAADVRAAPRSNMYIAVALSSPDCSSPAKIRNMSASGALVEAHVLPIAGSPVRLVRGSLSVEGTIAWSDGGRCGIQFSSLVSVRRWMAPPRNKEQERVDEAVALLKAGVVPLSEAHRQRLAGGVNGDLHPPEQLAQDLRETCDLLNALGAELAQDQDVAHRHGARLQSLDIATQTLDAAIALLLSGSARDGDSLDRLQGLRSIRAQAGGRPG